MIFDRYSALILALPIAFAAAAQPTLVAPGNVPVPGDGFTVHRGDYAAMPSGGEAQLFDFSGLDSESTLTYQWKAPADMPTSADFPGTQFVLVNGGPDTIYYRATASGLERIGDTQTIVALGNEFHLVTSYSDGVIDLKLPLSFDDGAWTDLFEGTFEVDEDVNERNGAITGEADAWGWVVLPGGADTVEVLRVNTRVTETIPLATGLGTINVAHAHNQSAYYPLWGKFPVLRTVSDTLDAGLITLSEAYTEWLDSGSVGIAELPVDAFKAQVFPNPATDQAVLVFSNGSMKPVEVQVVDARGSVVQQMRTTQRIVDLDLGGLEQGIYGVVLTNEQGQRSTVRLMVVR